MRYWKPLTVIAISAVAYLYLLFLTWYLAALAGYPWEPYAGKSRELVLTLALFESAIEFIPAAAIIGSAMAYVVPTHKFPAALVAALPCVTYTIYLWPLPSTWFSTANYLIHTLWAAVLPCIFALAAAKLISNNSFKADSLRLRP
jgi:hypothetical protein